MRGKRPVGKRDDASIFLVSLAPVVLVAIGVFSLAMDEPIGETAKLMGRLIPVTCER